MKRTPVALILVGAVFAVVTSGFASGRGSQGLPVTDDVIAPSRGCRDGGFKNKNRVNPSWVSVEASDEAQVAEGMVRVSQVTYEDFPNCHESHDWNVYVKLDEPYHILNSDHNRKYNAQGKADPNGDYVIEMEWETKQFPNEFLPIFGDRAWMIGRWVFDCGHPDQGFRSEIHPPKGVAFTREEPHVFAGDTQPTNANKVFAYFNGQGGYYYDRLGGRSYEFDVPMPPRPSSSAQPHVEVISAFGGTRPQITLPQVGGSPPSSQPAPLSPEAQKRLEELRKRIQEAKKAALEFGELPERPGIAERIEARKQEIQERIRNRSVPGGGPVARIKYDFTSLSDPPKWDQYGVKWVLKSPSNPAAGFTSQPPRPANTPRFGAILALGWKHPTTTRAYRVLKVTFDSIKIINDHDSPFSGEWRLWLQANGNWFQVQGLGDVDDGDTVQIRKSILLTVPEDGTVQIQATGWESDSVDDDFSITNPTSIPLSVAGDLTGHINSPLGVINYRYKTSFAPGLYQQQSIGGDYRLDYRIEELQRIPAGTPIAVRTPSKRVTVTFQSLKVLKMPKPVLGLKGSWFEFGANSLKFRHPAKDLDKSLAVGQTINLNMATRPMTLGPNHTVTITAAGRGIGGSLGDISQTFSYAQNFGPGTYTKWSSNKEGQFELTYRIDVQDAP